MAVYRRVKRREICEFTTSNAVKTTSFYLSEYGKGRECIFRKHLKGFIIIRCNFRQKIIDYESYCHCWCLSSVSIDVYVLLNLTFSLVILIHINYIVE